MRAQDFVGWLVPAYVLATSAAVLVGDLSARRYSHVWLPLAGLAFGVALAIGLLRRRREWLETQGRQGESSPLQNAAASERLGERRVT